MELWFADAAKMRASVAQAEDRPVLAMVLTLGPAERFGSIKQVGSYFGLIPSEESSGGKQRLGRISKQGSSFLRFLLVEAGQTAARLDPQLKRFYKCHCEIEIEGRPWSGSQRLFLQERNGAFVKPKASPGDVSPQNA
jgi:hypothetical protein